MKDKEPTDKELIKLAGLEGKHYDNLYRMKSHIVGDFYRNQDVLSALRKMWDEKEHYGNLVDDIQDSFNKMCKRSKNFEQQLTKANELIRKEEKIIIDALTMTISNSDATESFKNDCFDLRHKLEK